MYTSVQVNKHKSTQVLKQSQHIKGTSTQVHIYAGTQVHSNQEHNYLCTLMDKIIKNQLKF